MEILSYLAATLVFSFSLYLLWQFYEDKDQFDRLILDIEKRSGKHFEYY